MRHTAVAATAGAVITLLIGTGRPQTVAPLFAIAVLASGCLAARAEPRQLLGFGTAGGFVSVLCTGSTWVWDWPPLPVWGLVEVPALSVVVGLIARHAPPSLHTVFSAALVGLGAASCVVRFAIDDLSPLGAVYGLAAWAFIPALAGSVGIYQRRQHVARSDAVEAARRNQRLKLAQDLHDYVAHDVTDMIAVVQAAQLVVAAEPIACSLLMRAESAGQRAMSSLDRTVTLLSDGADIDRPLHAPDGLSDLGALVDRFCASGVVRAQLEIDEVLFAATPRDIGATAHRVVVESLTNIRRHAPSATLVDVRLSHVGQELEVLVQNDAAVGSPSAAGRLRRGGIGLRMLRERVEALGGALTAGPHDRGWRVRANFPLTSTGRPAT